jgi:glyoxylate/hydroxypyruvate reductase A
MGRRGKPSAPGALLFISHLDDPAAWKRELTSRIPGLGYRVGPGLTDADDVEVALVWAPPPGELKRYPNLKAILSLGAGVDHILNDPELPRGVPIARLVDPMLTRLMSEYVLLAALRHHREFDVFERHQRRRLWEYRFPPDAARRRVGVMGLGVLGADAAAKLAANGFAVQGWSRRPKRIAGARTYHGPRQLERFLNATDVLVCLLPLTPATRGLLDRRVFAALPKGAFLVNPSRGALLVDDDLIEALDSGHLAGATLDVFHREPLPRDHPFWRHPKVLVTPHIAAAGYPETAAPQVAENVRRALAGRPLLHPVDPEAGY